MHVRTGVHVRECICLCLLIIHGYFFQTKYYALLCMIYSSVSQAAVFYFFYFLESGGQLEFGRCRVLGSQGHCGELVIVKVLGITLFQLFTNRLLSLSAKGARCKVSAKKSCGAFPS